MAAVAVATLHGSGVSRPLACRFGQLQIQVESLRQHIKCVAHYLLRVLAKLPIEARIVVCVDAAFEGFGVTGSVKEPRRDTQCANPIPIGPCSDDLVALANHVVGHVTVER
jgi:hypothetical protein